jgi:hypothetical protein
MFTFLRKRLYNSVQEHFNQRGMKMQTKKARTTYLGTLHKKVVANDELKDILQNAGSYESRMKAYREYWIPDNFIEENASWINWTFITSYQPLSTKLIEKYHLKIDFDNLITYQKVPQKILLKFHEQIDVDKLTKYHPLSEKFITKYHDFFGMAWSNIVFYQKLSLQFLIDNKDEFEIEDLEGGKVNEQTIDNYKIFLKMGVI